MIDDDDLFVVIVDENAKNSGGKNNYKLTNELEFTPPYEEFENDWEEESLKETERDDSKSKHQVEVEVGDVLYAAQEHGEILHFEDEEIIEELSEDEMDIGCDIMFKDIKPRFVCDDDPTTEDSTDEEDVQSENKIVPSSYVQMLKEKFPHLSNNKEYIIRTIAQKMKNIYPPLPPLNYYVTCENDVYRCKFCLAKSSTQSIAERHYQEKHGERYLVCYACGARFRCPANLYKHEKMSCKAPDIAIVLEARAKFWELKGRKPSLYSDDRKRFPCSECSATFANKKSVEAHLRLHRGERPFQCSQCPKAYTSSVALTLHLKTHGDVQFICDSCGKEFKDKTKLVTHLNSHASVKKFGCEQCPKRYMCKADLIVHVNTDHLNLPLPFDCKICPKRFARMSSLKCHMKKIHGMVIITKKMFAKQLPRMSETARELRLKEAIVVLKNPSTPDRQARYNWLASMGIKKGES